MGGHTAEPGVGPGCPAHPPEPRGLSFSFTKGHGGSKGGEGRVGQTSSAVILSAWDINSRLMLRATREEAN